MANSPHKKIPTRRAFLRQSLATAALTATSPLWWPSHSFAAEPIKPSAQEEARMGEIARQFLQDFKIRGLSVAVAKQGTLVYQEGFGMADEAGENVSSSHIFRIASVSKPITSVALFSLREQKRLKLDDFIFGPDGHLGFDYGKKYPQNVNRITVHHLLTHTGGGWGNTSGDPMFSNPQMNHHDLIEWTLINKPLENEPGTHYQYSNFGFCVLGRLIEKLSGKSYVAFCRETILRKCGINDMRLATNDRVSNEVHYFGGDEDPYSMNVSRMDSHGGWLATSSDLVRFAMHVDGFDSSPDILQQDTIKSMTSPTIANPNYACGWCVNGAPNWWHNGSLPGTSAIIVRTASGLCWAALTNGRSKGIDLALDQMMWQIVKAVPAWKA